MTLWQMMFADLAPLHKREIAMLGGVSGRDRFMRRLLKRPVDGVREQLVPRPRRLSTTRIVTVRYLPFWNRMIDADLDQSLLTLIKSKR
jgi:hypothetical protein